LLVACLMVACLMVACLLVDLCYEQNSKNKINFIAFKILII